MAAYEAERRIGQFLEWRKMPSKDAYIIGVVEKAYSKAESAETVS